MPNKKPDRIFPSLTGVRAIAAYMVFFHHYILQCDTNIFLSIVKEFYTGVTVFFVLSGFLIYYKYSNEVKLNKEFLLNYFKNRLARVYPVYFFIVIFTALVYYGANHIWGQKEVLYLILELTFLRGFFNSYKFIGVGQGWTLSVEESFYALFPLLIASIKKWGFVISLTWVYLMGAALIWIGATLKFKGFFSPSEFVFSYTFFGRAAEFFIGMYLAKIILLQDNIKLRKSFPVFTLSGLLGLGLGLFFMSRYQQDCGYGAYYISGILINNLILPVFIAILFFGLLKEDTVIKKFLGSRIMVFLGKTSYTFYLIHVGVIQFILQNTISKNILVIFILMNLFAIIIYLTIEEPMRKTIRDIKFKQDVQQARP